jgi:hypothetical protein
MVIDTSQIDWTSRKIPLTSAKIPWVFIKILAGFPSYSIVIPGIFQTRISGKQADLRKVNRNIQNLPLTFRRERYIFYNLDV